VRLVALDGVSLVVLGVIIGFAASFAVTRVMVSILSDSSFTSAAVSRARTPSLGNERVWGIA
jgi:hypothetical protein